MKVLYVAALYPPHVGGGAELALANLVRAFRRRGQDAAVLTTHGGTGVLQEQVDGVPVTRLAHRNVYWSYPQREHVASARVLWHAIDSLNLPMGRQAGRAIDQIRPDLIVCHNLPGLSVSVWAQAAARGIPLVQVLHDYYTLCPSSTMFRAGQACASPCASCSVFRLPHRRASKAVSAVVGVSRAVLDRHVSEGLFGDAEIQAVVHNARALPPPPARNASTGEVFSVGFIGGLTPVKGVDLLAQAFAAVARDSRRPMRLLIAGAGTADEEARLKAAHASQQVEFVGHVDPLAFFPQLDVCVVPSLWHDPFPGVVYESLGLGVPVIGSRRGGIPEIVRDEVNGLLFDPGQAGALEACLRRLRDQPALLQSMRLASRSSVATLLDEDRMLDEYDALYHRVLESATSA